MCSAGVVCVELVMIRRTLFSMVCRVMWYVCNRSSWTYERQASYCMEALGKPGFLTCILKGQAYCVIYVINLFRVIDFSLTREHSGIYITNFVNLMSNTIRRLINEHLATKN